jgi:hypothetical protein
MTEPTRFVPWKESAEWLATAVAPSATVTAPGVTDSDTLVVGIETFCAAYTLGIRHPVERAVVMTRSPAENAPGWGVFGVAGGLVTALGQP